MTICIVDDSAFSRNRLSECLRELGFMSIHCFERGDDFLEVLEHITPEIIFIDAVMPGMDGFTLAPIVRERLPFVCMIGLGGYLGSSSLFQEVGVSLVLQKPFYMSSVLAVIPSKSAVLA
jgi:CheY-like chemotaxis protein